MIIIATLCCGFAHAQLQQNHKGCSKTIKACAKCNKITSITQEALSKETLKETNDRAYSTFLNGWNILIGACTTKRSLYLTKFRPLFAEFLSSKTIFEGNWSHTDCKHKN